MEGTKTKKTCPICKMVFTKVYSKNRHLRLVHNQQEEDLKTRKSHLICPLCRRNEFHFATYTNLENHLEVNHQIKIELISYSFSSKKECQQWLQEEAIEVNYTMYRTRNNPSHTEKNFICNRSNSRGFESKCSKRTGKAGGSVKMYGVCPSRLNITFYETGYSSVTFWKTHVGHEEEVRSQHSSKVEKGIIVEKLVSGVSVDRIITDSRKVTGEKLERINMVTRKDIEYLSKKHNITKRKHQNTLIAVSLKVNEWNANGKKYCFFYKQQVKDHMVLRKKDFALGFMNDTMERKLTDCSRIICMDGTHCTNQKGMDLTVMLVKDDKNMGFPVAFF